MTNRQQTAERVALMINDAERAMDVAMARASALVAELPQLQAEAGLNAAWAQPAVASICSALADMTSARGSIITAHKALSAIERKMGVTVMETPNNTKTPPLLEQQAEVVRLRA